MSMLNLLNFQYLITHLGFLLIKIIIFFIGIVYLTTLGAWGKNKVMASIQRRSGPPIVGIWGLLQPLTNGLKLLSKEMLIPSKANGGIFLASPILIIAFSLLIWGLIPLVVSK